jgi:hypothetical protein
MLKIRKTKQINKIIILNYFITTCEINWTSFFNAYKDLAVVIMLVKNHLCCKRTGLLRKQF